MPSHLESASLEKHWRCYSSVLLDLRSHLHGREEHLLFFLWSDLEQAARSMALLFNHDTHSTIRRECRFVVEASVRIAAVEQNLPDAPIAAKLQHHSFANSGVKRINEISLDHLNERCRAAFKQEVISFYETSCKHVHLSGTMTKRRMHLTYEQLCHDPLEPARIVNLVTRALGISTVVLMHALPADVPKLLLSTLASADLGPLGIAVEKRKLLPTWPAPVVSSDIDSPGAG